MEFEMDIFEIMEVLPHRYPFLLVDRIVEFEPKKKIVGIKNVTINEPFFNGHFPGHPIMPGVLIIEAMAQVGGILMLKSFEMRAGDVVIYFMGVDKARFRNPVRPGDQLKLVLEPIVLKRTVSKMKGIAYVGDKVAAEAEIMASVVKK
ncbi:3-hydroxyacyl-[acyl-carrier-protein] dehydratase [Desulfurobacterium atlanticum]|uniref:3-hydroxyacyl-[acyl-carrier-protein] dehydratase FabZ n=2 Tax=Desulfurobacterium atlanticum TaxID=240169 RepID=A0A238XV26_9BACT|nr:3-hydroxyacyl-ACP dehydratase FabZ [Desulfurobacterium atlanticum]SNR62174.1 3-hydroxyacyl-[acyl-carrier-protein] dehydratase [Desulfurobacterium atlanticum]